MSPTFEQVQPYSFSKFANMPQCMTFKRYFINIYNHISQGRCHHDLVCNDRVVVLNGDNGVNENSSPEHCSDELHEVGHHDDNEICNHVSKRLKSTTTTMVSTRKSTEKIDELVDREFDHCGDFDDNVSIQTSNTDLNNQLPFLAAKE